MRIRDIPVGEGAPLVLVSGLNVLETLEDTLATATALQALASRRGVPLVFKASYDKANRSRHGTYRGPGIDAGLHMLDRVGAETGLPLLVDVHHPEEAKPAAEVVDCLQIPAFLSRQTDLIAACAATGLPINLKKGQFMAPEDALRAVEKALGFGASGVMVTERGSVFGYHDLVVDLRALVRLRSAAPVCLDATHAVQRPGAGPDGSGGERQFVAPLARAAAAVGIDALFVETHPDPERAPCDGPCLIRVEDLDALLADVLAIRGAISPG